MFQRHHHQEAIPDTCVPALAPMAAPGHHLCLSRSELREDRKPVCSVHGRAPCAQQRAQYSVNLSQCLLKEPTNKREPGKAWGPPV